MHTDELVRLILDIARVPSFTSHEDRLHPLIEKFCADLDHATVSFPKGNNVLIESAGADHVRPVALSAHLDKINHFGKDQTSLSATIIDNDTTPRLRGLLDDAVGVGICLHLLKQAQHGRFPPLHILLSECEESAMFRRNPALLKHGGEGLSAGIGARRLAEHLLATQRVPAMVIVVDVTPLFHGDPGIALYSDHWEQHGDTPSEQLRDATERVAEKFMTACPRMRRDNNMNDYVHYGEHLNRGGMMTPCFAIEPSIENYHSADEMVYVDDIAETVAVLTKLLEAGFEEI